MKKEMTKLRRTLKKIVNNKKLPDKNREKAREALDATYDIEKEHQSN